MHTELNFIIDLPIGFPINNIISLSLNIEQNTKYATQVERQVRKKAYAHDTDS